LNEQIDLRVAINAISDVVQNRPRPLREFDQIYMKTGDMVLQSEYVAHWAQGRSLAFVGDGDAISVCVAYLHARDVLSYGPSRITVFDFDERVVMAVKRFADRERLDMLDAQLYNCIDPIPDAGSFDCFYSNPPWGASNGGRSVILFARRGMELIAYEGEGLLVIADRDSGLPWTEEVLANVQSFGVEQGFYVGKMMERVHEYHLDDNPELRSCNLILRSRPGNGRDPRSELADAAELKDFYGAGIRPQVRYVRERNRVDYGKAHSDEYSFELIDGGT
jgi:predicted methyltransferase